MNKKLYIGYDENINDFRIGSFEELNSFDSIEIKDLLEDFEIDDIIDIAAMSPLLYLSAQKRSSTFFESSGSVIGPSYSISSTAW